MVHWHEQENALSFLLMRKWILANEIYVLWDFTLWATSWSCVGATSWDYAGATSWGPEHRKVPHMVQSVTHSTKCHIVGYVFHRKKMRKFEGDRKRFLWIYFIIFPKDHGISSIALCISKYVFSIRKTSLLTEFCTHYSLLWFSFQKAGLIRDEWQVEDGRWFG